MYCKLYHKRKARTRHLSSLVATSCLITEECKRSCFCCLCIKQCLFVCCQLLSVVRFLQNIQKVLSLNSIVKAEVPSAQVKCWLPQSSCRTSGETSVKPVGQRSVLCVYVSFIDKVLGVLYRTSCRFKYLNIVVVIVCVLNATAVCGRFAAHWCKPLVESLSSAFSILVSCRLVCLANLCRQVLAHAFNRCSYTRTLQVCNTVPQFLLSLLQLLQLARCSSLAEFFLHCVVLLVRVHYCVLVG